MLKGLVSYAFAGFSGGEIGNLLSKWEAQGVFTYVLPFLLLFALIFSILSRMKIFAENRGINVVIALVVALMSLQFEFVPKFFSEVFPRLGVGISIILVVLIMIGMFMDPDKPGLMITLMVIGGIIAAVVLLNSASAAGYETGSWISDNIEWVIAIIIFIVLFFAIVARPSSDRNKREPWRALMHRD